MGKFIVGDDIKKGDSIGHSSGRVYKYRRGLEWRNDYIFAATDCNEGEPVYLRNDGLITTERPPWDECRWPEEVYPNGYDRLQPASVLISDLAEFPFAPPS